MFGHKDGRLVTLPKLVVMSVMCRDVTMPEDEHTVDFFFFL